MYPKPLTPEERHWRETPPEQLGEELAEKHLEIVRETTTAYQLKMLRQEVLELMETLIQVFRRDS